MKFDQPKRLPYIPPMNRSARKFSEAIDSSTLSQQFTSFSVLFDVPERNNTMDLISEVLKIDEEMKSVGLSTLSFVAIVRLLHSARFLNVKIYFYQF